MTDHDRRSGDKSQLMPYQFEGRLARLETDMDSIKVSLDHLNHSLDRMSADLSNNNRTPWSMLASWAGVILTIVALVGASYVRDLGRLDAEVVKVEERALRSDELHDEIYRLTTEYLETRVETLERQLEEK